MKITPLEIRQKAFEKVFRGFDKDEVDAFLQILSSEWEKMVDEKKELSIKLESAEKEISKLREVEDSLYKTLKTAEDTGANMIVQANKASELQLKESQMKSENIVSEAKSKSKMIIDSTEKHARQIINNMLDEIKLMEHNFNTALNLKENLLADLTNLSSETLERVQKFKKRKDKSDIDKYINEARDFVTNFNLKNHKYSEGAVKDSPEKQEPEPIVSQIKNTVTTEKSENSESSFFDQLD
jgi:cell division initiation protein